jgi:hypothetical protein
MAWSGPLPADRPTSNDGTEIVIHSRRSHHDRGIIAENADGRRFVVRAEIVRYEAKLWRNQFCDRGERRMGLARVGIPA